MTVTKRKPKPITAHPMFPVVTALWFAAFLSLGSFAVAPALLEGPVVALGIPEILPAAQPPLGFTVRALVAIVMMGVGGLIGYLIGRRLASAKQEMPVRTRAFGRAEAADSPVVQPSNAKPANHRRPLNPIEDLGEPSVVGEFTLTNELPADGAAPFAEPMPAIVETAHLPWDDDFGFDQPAIEHEEVRGEVRGEHPLAFDLLLDDAAVVAHEDVGDGQDSDAHQPFAAPVEAVAEEAVVDNALAAELPACDEIPAPSAPLIKAPLLQAPAAASLPLARTPLDDLGLVQLTERLALAIGRRNARAAAAHQAPAAPYAVPAAEPFAAPVASEIESEDAPEEAAHFAVAAPRPAPAIARFHSAQTDADAPAQVSELSTERVVQLRPAALQPFVPEADVFDEDDVPGLDRFLRVPAQAFEPAADLESEALDADVLEENDDEDVAVWDDDDGTAEGAEARYPSLLDMGTGSHRAQALRLSHDEEEDDGETVADKLEPVVVFPSQSSPLHANARPFDGPSAIAAPATLAPSSILAVAGSPLAAPGRAAPSSPLAPLEETPSATAGVVADAEEADRALRAALATLQRMTAQG